MRDRGLLVKKLRECQAINQSISAVSNTIDFIGTHDLVRTDGFSDFHIFGLNRAVNHLGEHQSKSLEAALSLVDESAEI